MWAKNFDFEMENMNSYIRLKAPNCILIFRKKNSENEISHIVIANANENKRVIIEGTKYLFHD